MKEDIDKLIKSVFKKKLPPTEPVREETSFQRILDTAAKEIPLTLTGVDREDFITLMHAAALMYGGFICLDHAYDPSKHKSEAQHRACLRSGEELVKQGAKALQNLKNMHFRTTVPNDEGEINIEVHRRPDKKEG